MRTITYAMMVLMLGAVAVHAADDLQSLQKRMKARYAQLVKLKSAGKIGETWSGYVEPVKPEFRDAVSSLINAENADRRSLYRLMAEEEGLTADEVAKNNAVRNFQKARKGEYLKGPDGNWKQK